MHWSADEIRESGCDGEDNAMRSWGLMACHGEGKSHGNGRTLPQPVNAV